MESKKELISYLNNISLFLLGITLLVFPLAIATLTTDTLTLPKQIVVGICVLVILLLFAVKTISEKKVIFRRTPLDLPIVLFIVAALASSIFAINRLDSFVSFVPFLLSSFIYFVIVNTAKDRSSINFLNASFITGATVIAVIAIASFFKIYPLPFAFTHSQTFTTLGSQLEQAIYLVIASSFVISLSWPLIKRLTSGKTSAFEKARIQIFEGGFLFATVILLAGVVIALISLVKLQHPIILPFQTGFQTAFAEISQDTGRIAQGFLLGSGFGNYGTDFARFKPVSFNQYADLWSLSFIRSSSFVLEILATTGILGLAAFAFLLYKLFKEKTYFKPILLIVTAAFILPFSFITQTLFFILLGLYGAREGLSEKNQHKYFDVEPHFVTLKRGILSLSSVSEGRRDEKFLPFIFFAAVAILVGAIGLFVGRYILSDITFKKSLVAASANNISQTYKLQEDVIKTFPYKDTYFRSFSYTNLFLATNLASQQPKDSSPSAKVQQDFLTLTRLSINNARQATVVAPQTAANWTNFSNIYKNLIAYGWQDAGQFAIAYQQQAIALDPNNPNEYINLGRIYYQLGLWDNAQSQFQIAINLKPDLANSYYNLGHVLEQKGDLKNALLQYQTVKNLVTSDKTNLSTINKEIETLQQKIDSGVAPSVQTGTQTQLPAQNPPVQIPSPPATSSAN